MSSKNIGLVFSQSLSQPGLNVSINDSLDDILWITEPFVTKPCMVMHHYTPECHVEKWVAIFKVKVPITEFGVIHEIMTVSVICSELYYMGFFPSDLLCLRPSRSKYNTSTINYLLGVFSTVWPKLVCSELLIFWGDQFSLTVHAHKLECLAERLFCCIQGQGHSDGSELQWMFARTISLGQVVKHVSDQGNQHNNGPHPRSDFW